MKPYFGTLVLFCEAFDRKFKDAFAIEADVGQKVVENSSQTVKREQKTITESLTRPTLRMREL